jgi:AcrR family transcriptional regulator
MGADRTEPPLSDNGAGGSRVGFPGSDYAGAAAELTEAEFGDEVRLRLCRAALAVLTERGVAGLALVAVDRRAGLPAGTCRAVYRTRRALVAAMFEAVAVTYRESLAAATRGHPDDPVAAAVEILYQQLGPVRDTTRALWAALMDPGVRPAADLYAEALLLSSDKAMADLLGVSLAQYRLVWPMAQGLVSHTLMRNLPTPDIETMTALLRALLDLVHGRPAVIPPSVLPDPPEHGRPGP